MKVAMIVPGGVDRSGELRVIPSLIALIGRLAAEHELHVFATHQEANPDSWMLEGARVHNLGLPRTVWRALSAIRAEHRREPFNLIHAFWAARQGAVAVIAAALLRLPSIVHVAGGELVALTDIHYGGRRAWRHRVLVDAVLRRATIVTCASTPMLDLVAESGVQAHRVALGVDLQRWPPRQPLPRRAGEPARLVHIASLNRVKDQATLLAAMCRLAEAGRVFHLDVIGEDTLGGRIQAMASERGLSQSITFHGFLTQRHMRPIVEAAHVAVFSSRHEAGPVALLETALAGVPAVGTAVGHIAEWSPEAALAVPCQDPDALAAALSRLLDDEDLRLRLANAALRRAQREDVDATARAFNDMYRQVTEPM
jgi:glycosyltransferase involved in cell wall biosynthesis